MNVWKPGQSGNPSGHSALYGETVRLAREAAPAAICRLIELMGSEDERVASVTCNAILDRAFGKPKEYDPDQAERMGFSRLSDEELKRRLLQGLIDAGLPEEYTRAFVRGEQRVSSPRRVVGQKIRI